MENYTMSYWNQTGPKTYYSPLSMNIKTDVLIIGGGITGVTSAYYLADKGLRPVLIEAGELCNGTTGNTTGKVTSQHGIIYSDIASKYGEHAAKAYFEAQNSALAYVKNIVCQEAIDCQLAENTSYLYAADESQWSTISKEYHAAMRCGADAELVEKPMFPVSNFGMLGYKGQVVLHPARYIDGLAKAAVKKGASFYCNTKATNIEKGDIVTVTCEGNLVINAKHLVIATGYPIYDAHNLFFTRLYPRRTYGIALKTKRDWPNGSYITADSPTRSFRTHLEDGQPILIVAGDGHVTGRGSEDMSVHFENLMQFAESLAGVREMLSMWSAQDYETPDKLPYICRCSDLSNVYTATGYRKWGLTNGTLAGTMLADLIANGGCQYEELFSKKRTDILTAPGKVLSGNLSAVGELIKSKFERTKGFHDLQVGEGRIISFKGEKAGIYRDNNDDVTILDITCTHMGTELNFNMAEKTWDCPAHGGRFGTDGKLLEGPPKRPLETLFRGKYDDLFEEE